ncbi:Dynein, light chain [Nesidiocoris tenuis]|uniref:Dynein, light chain n=1 Tax=Nesidiocoris tenuis TaxID=355587 RepID=A0ABN7AYE6_9HEMI|nr:Dynein, light chain [Nesidiocoris tenuis]
MCQKFGPFDIDVRTLENCGQSTYGDGIVFTPHFKKYNRSVFVVTCPVHMPYDLDDTMECVVDMAVFTNGGWKENFYTQKFYNLCTTMKQFAGNLMKSMLKTAGLKTECPVLKGNYTVKDWPMALNVDVIPAFYYNRYKWRVKIYKSNRMVGCLRSLVDVIPKKKRP